MRQLVSKRAIEITHICPQHDRSGAGYGDSRPPLGHAACGKRIQDPSIRNNYEPKRSGTPSTKARPLGWLRGPAGKIQCQAKLIGPGHSGYLTDLDCLRLNLGGRRTGGRRGDEEEL
jgi:hypothetical protein